MHVAVNLAREVDLLPTVRLLGSFTSFQEVPRREFSYKPRICSKLRMTRGKTCGSRCDG